MDEFGLIARFVAAFGVAAPPRGPGDDCAVLGPRPAEVVTVDAVVESWPGRSRVMTPSA